jgi:hypothetical protein
MQGGHLVGSFCRSSKRVDHTSQQSIVSIINASYCYDFPGAAGVLLSLEYTICSLYSSSSSAWDAAMASCRSASNVCLNRVTNI